jgi:hypothetical protein
LLGEANDELDRYKEKNYDQLYIEAFLREDLVDLRKQIEAANTILKEGCTDQDGNCPFTDDGVCYDETCVLAQLKTILKIPSSREQKENP